jgi:hypothetical protein
MQRYKFFVNTRTTFTQFFIMGDVFMPIRVRVDKTLTTEIPLDNCIGMVTLGDDELRAPG